MRLQKVLPIVICVLFGSGCQPLIQPPIVSPVAVNALADGERIDIGGRSLWLRCQGEGSPTVILEAGLGADHAAWDQVQPDAARLTRVCSYDRAGLGASDPAPTLHTTQHMVDDLHALLTQANVQGPYVLVGHSIGGLPVRLYARQFPDDVVGLVLVDAVHEDWWKRSAAYLMPELVTEDQLLAELQRFNGNENGEPHEKMEAIDMATSVAQLRVNRNLGDLPLIVLIAGIPDVAASLPEALQTPLVRLLQVELPADLVKLSSNSVALTVPDSGHNIPQQKPAVVLAAIQTLVEIGRGE